MVTKDEPLRVEMKCRKEHAASLFLTLLGGVTVESMNSAPGFAAEAQAKVAEESEKIKNEYEEKLAEMKRMYEQEQSSKENLLDEMNRLKTEYDRKLSSVENQYPVHMNVVSVGLY